MTAPRAFASVPQLVSHQPSPVTPSVLAYLQTRLSVARSAPAPADDDWQYGLPSAELDRLVAHWRGGFEWVSFQHELDAFESISFSGADGEGDAFALHMLARSAEAPADATLMLIHGWPGTVLDYVACARFLTRSNASPMVDVIIVSPPGFGLSDRPAAPVNARKMARSVAAVLEAIDGPVVVHGNDWGASIASWLAFDRPELVAGIHLGMMGLKPALGKDDALSDEERSWLGFVKKRLGEDNGYAELQSSVPSTLGAALADSPLATLAWVAEKYRRWSGPDPRQPNVGDDAILAQATLHWAANDLPSAAWIYWAERHRPEQIGAGQRIAVPTGFTLCEGGFFPPPPPEWCARAHDIVLREILPAGGHFGAWLQPEAYAASLLRFCEKVIK